LAADFEADVADGFLGGKRKSRHSAETGFFAKTRFLKSSTLSRKSVFSFFQKTQISLLARNQVFSKNLVSYISVS
jgi:hypothetical protein